MNKDGVVIPLTGFGMKDHTIWTYMDNIATARNNAGVSGEPNAHVNEGLEQLFKAIAKL